MHRSPARARSNSRTRFRRRAKPSLVSDFSDDVSAKTLASPREIRCIESVPLGRGLHLLIARRQRRGCRNVLGVLALMDRRAFLFGKDLRGIDQADVTEGLREIP